MSFVVIGLNHTTAPLEVLEQVAVATDEIDKALHDVSSRPHVSEAVVLSTCNRTEVYVTAERFHGAFQDVRDFLAESSHLAPEALQDSLYTFYDDQAIEHLFRVSAGVDSAVLGEHEILGQVKRSWQAAQAHGCVGAGLNAIFRSSLEVGKRVRTETGIARNIASVSQAAIAMACDRLGDLEGKRALLVGAGEMGNGMALSLADQGLAELTVMSRTAERAAEIAERIDADARPIGELADALIGCDIAFTSTAAPSLVVEAEVVADVMARRSGRPLLVIDVAMPRDVDPEAASIDGIELCDLDDVGDFVSRGLESRGAEVARAVEIIDHEVHRHVARESERSVAPLISEFRDQADEIRRRELTRQSARLGDLTDEQRQAVDEVTRLVLAKVLHTPTVRLKESASSLRGERLSAALRDLFDLD